MRHTATTKEAATIKNGNEVPEIKSWKICIESEYGDTNRRNVEESFKDFRDSPELDELHMKGCCYVSGLLSGHHLIPDGNEIVTSNIRRLFIPNDAHYRTSGQDHYRLIGIEDNANNKYFVALNIGGKLPIKNI